MNFTRCSNTSNITEIIEEYLQQLQDKTNITVIPAVIMLCIFSVVGVPGNILVLTVYSKKQKINATEVLIMAIASFDIVANVAAIPMEIYIMLTTWHFQIAVVCKMTAFLDAFTVVGKALSLFVVAFIRYRKVCKPFGWHVRSFSSRQAKISSFVLFLLAIVFSIPYFIIYGVKTRQTPCPNIQGSECFVDDKYINTIWPLLDNVFFLTIYLLLSITLVIMYVFIGKAARAHRKSFGVSENSTQTSRNKKSIAATDKEKTIFSAVLSTNTSASFANTESAPLGMSQVLVCCSRHPKEQKSMDDTQSSMVHNMNTTTSRKKKKQNAIGIRRQVQM
ncbi:hypothetical protein BsWGS_14064 [Bradybaena similaris]